MSGGWVSSNRFAQLPPDWRQRSARCLRLAGGRCEQRLPSGARCPRRATDADHRSDPLNHDDLQALCAHHHKIKTGQEAVAAVRAKKALRTRPPEPHPGKLV